MDALISGGEGPGVEFKVELPPARASAKQLHFLNTVAAFANGEGGAILFGVADDGMGFPPVAGHAVMRPAVLAVDSR